MHRKIFSHLQSFAIGFLLTIGIWYVAYLIIGRHVMPSPFTVFQALPLLLNHNILTHIYHSLFRIFAALLLSICIGLTTGLAMSHEQCAKILTPFVYFTYPIPRVALLPVILLVFGLRDLSKIIMITLIVVYPIIIVVRDSVKGIPKESYSTLICLGANKRQVFFSVTLPWAVSGILSTLRISLGTAIAILFFTEAYGTRYGMGFFVLEMWQRINYVMMFAGIVVLSLVGFLLFILIDILEGVLLRWQR